MKKLVAIALVLAGCSGGGSGGSASGNPAKFSGPGPWGLDNRQFGAADGILEQPVVGFSTDEAQNLWVATHSGLYLMKPGDKTFRRFGVKDGLHLSGNPVSYCDSSFTGGDRMCPILGAAADPGISEIAGGAPGEVFVGYFGNDDGSQDWSDPNRHTGKLDRVRLKPDGSLQADRFDLVNSTTAEYWHNRTVQRLLYDHLLQPHELYVGTNHGVDRILPDKFRPPAQGEWFLKADAEWMSDHLHPQVCYHHACDASLRDLMLGDWKGLALSSDGNLWVGGRWTAGQIRWTQDLSSWATRLGNQTYAVAFGDPYVRGQCTAEAFCNQPVYLVDQEGDTISVQAVAVAADGRVWFASGRTTTVDNPRGLAVWDGKNFRYYGTGAAGMAETDVRDMVALPDGRLVLAGATTGLVLWNPQSGASVPLRAPQWIPDDHVWHIELDQMVDPPTLHVATWSGAAALRKLP